MNTFARHRRDMMSLPTSQCVWTSQGESATWPCARACACAECRPRTRARSSRRRRCCSSSATCGAASSRSAYADAYRVLGVLFRLGLRRAEA
eukprot:6184860-Pleurochrysis_carterae.AAC.1